MKINTRIALCSAALAVTMLPAVAQNSNPPANPARQPPATINQRKENQQDRIANGVASGQLPRAKPLSSCASGALPCEGSILLLEVAVSPAVSCPLATPFAMRSC